MTGWGRLYEGRKNFYDQLTITLSNPILFLDGPLPSVLQEVSVPVINNGICEDMYRSAGYIEHIPHIFICAGWKKGGYDSCEGKCISVCIHSGKLRNENKHVFAKSTFRTFF